MKKHKCFTLFVLIFINLLMIFMVISPFIPIKDSFKKDSFDSGKTTILIQHYWEDKSDVLLFSGAEVLDYINGEKDIDYLKLRNNQYKKLNLSNKNPFTYLAVPFYSEQKSALYVLEGNFDSSLDDTFYVDEWYELDSKTLLGQTKLYVGDSIINNMVLLSLILFIPFFIFSCFIVIRIYRK